MINCSGATFEGANLNGSEFSTVDLQGASFNHSKIPSVTFHNSKMSRKTTFHDIAPESVENCTIDKFSLYCLEDGRSELTDGHLMRMNIVDDVATLRASFSGYWAFFHYIAVTSFLFPFVWFVFARLILSVDSLSHDGQHATRMIWAILGFIYWREDWSNPASWWPSWAFYLTLVYAMYHSIRVVLFLKTKELENRQAITELPVMFSLSDSILAGEEAEGGLKRKVQDLVKPFTWGKLYRAYCGLFGCGVVAGLGNALNFLIYKWVVLP